MINWFGTKGLLKDTVNQTAYTLKEEDIHAQVGIELVNAIKRELPELFDAELESRVLHEAQEAFDAESKIIDWMVEDFSSDVLDKDILKEFVKNRINESLEQIGYRKIFKIDHMKLEKTMWFYINLRGNGKSDFFSHDPVDYAKANQSFEIEDLFDD